MIRFRRWLADMLIRLGRRVNPDRNRIVVTIHGDRKRIAEELAKLTLRRRGKPQT
jgi:hypothetical protein